MALNLVEWVVKVFVGEGGLGRVCVAVQYTGADCPYQLLLRGGGCRPLLLVLLPAPGGVWLWPIYLLRSSGFGRSYRMGTTRAPAACGNVWQKHTPCRM